MNRRLTHLTGQSFDDSDTLHDIITQVAQRLRMDPVIMLGALAAQPHAASLWNEIERFLRPEHSPRDRTWAEFSASADAVIDTVGTAAPVTCWIAEPSDTADVFALASCLARRVPVEHLHVLATHTDPAVVEVGRSGLVSEAALRAAPPDRRDAHFRHLGRCWQATPEIRARVRFETASPFRPARGRRAGVDATYHLVVSQGHLFRLEAPAAQRLSVRLHRALRLGGFLLVGPGDHDVPLFRELDRCVAPGVMLYRKRRACGARPALPEPDIDFAALLAAIEKDPTAWEPRWRLADLLLREGHAEPAMAHLRELLRWRPDASTVWQMLAQAHMLLGDTVAAAAARRRAGAFAVPSGQAAAGGKLLM